MDQAAKDGMPGALKAHVILGQRWKFGYHLRWSLYLAVFQSVVRRYLLCTKHTDLDSSDVTRKKIVYTVVRIQREEQILGAKI